MQLAKLLEKAKAMLKTACKPPAEAYILAEHALGLSKDDQLCHPDIEVESQKQKLMLTDTQKRCTGYPLQYIIGSWEFYGLEFKVDQRVLIPRPDTEILVDYLLEKYDDRTRLIDLCCGSGCIGLTFCKKTGAKTILADISKGALCVCRQNAKALGLENCVQIIEKDILEGPTPEIELKEGDVIVSNPPYIKSSQLDLLEREVKYEPTLALDGGKDGLKFYCALISRWAVYMPKGCEMVLEAGYDTYSGVENLFYKAGFKKVATRRDYNNIVRLVSAIKD